MVRIAIFRALLAICAFSVVPHAIRSQDTANLPCHFQADVVYGHKDGMALTYDVMRPKEKEKGIGLLLMVSGGWVSAYTPPAQTFVLAKPFVDAGYTVVAVRHGSSPRYVIPEIVVDVRLALQHVADHAKEYGFDPSRMGVFGFSAGGHLSSVLGTTSNDKPGKAHVAAVAAVFPPTDLAPYVKKDNPLRERFPALKFDEDKAPELSPLMKVSSDDAPTLLVHGDKDELVPIWHSEKFHAAMKDAKVPTKLVVIEGAAHGFDEAGRKRMFENMVDWFDQHLSAKP